jgi:non-ribosomal peptide synthetase component F
MGVSAASHFSTVQVGSPMAGRNKLEMENLVGYFVNPVVLRGRIRKGITFQAFAHSISQAVRLKCSM